MTYGQMRDKMVDAGRRGEFATFGRYVDKLRRQGWRYVDIRALCQRTNPDIDDNTFEDWCAEAEGVAA